MLSAPEIWYFEIYVIDYKGLKFPSDVCNEQLLH